MRLGMTLPIDMLIRAQLVPNGVSVLWGKSGTLACNHVQKSSWVMGSVGLCTIIKVAAHGHVLLASNNVHECGAETKQTVKYRRARVDVDGSAVEREDEAVVLVQRRVPLAPETST